MDDADIANDAVHAAHEHAMRAHTARKATNEGPHATGYCVACGDAIPFGRLAIFPLALRCASCQHQHDSR